MAEQQVLIESEPQGSPEQSSAAQEALGPIAFTDFPIAAKVLEGIGALGFEEPTEVQSAVIQPGIEGRDLVVQSKTGSGKTAGFGLPLVERLKAGTSSAGKPCGLVLAPTRELAQQVAETLITLGEPKGLVVLALYGGASLYQQTQALQGSVDLVVATPGRLLDHIRRGNLQLSGITSVVLDEADEMLSMGFWDDVTDILKMAPKSKQTMLFSATLPYQVAKAAAEFLVDPVRLDLSGDALTVAGIVNQSLAVRPDVPKPRQLLYLLETIDAESAIIFCNTRNETELIAKYLVQAGFEAEALTGRFRQRDRERVMKRIKGGDLRFMVATDIAARGIDIEDLSHVVNYSLPEFSEVYLHRVGRTGRIGKLGTAVSLVDGKGLGTLGVLERDFSVSFTALEMPTDEEVLKKRSRRIMKELLERATVAEVGQHVPIAEEVLGSEESKTVVAFLLKEYFTSKGQSAQQDQGDASSERGERPRRQRRGRGGERGGERRDSDRNADDRSVEPQRASEGGGEESDDAGRRRRRRRRGGRREEGGGRDLEVMDAGEALAGQAPRSEGRGGARRTEGRNDRGRNDRNRNDRGRNDRSRNDRSRNDRRTEDSQINDGLTRLRVNIGFDDGFKGRGSVAKKISALAGLNDGIVLEVESRRDHAVLKATAEVAELVIERVDGAQVGKKVISVVSKGASQPQQDKSQESDQKSDQKSDQNQAG